MKFKKIFLTSAISISTFSFAQIQKVEPAFWWKGMKNPELQILVYGKNIANQSIELSDGVQIKELKKVENKDLTTFVKFKARDHLYLPEQEKSLDYSISQLIYQLLQFGIHIFLALLQSLSLSYL